jgi:hypothetical protein
LVNLRGLLTLMFEYVYMGARFGINGSLDKNMAPIMSRTDLAQVFQGALNPVEKAVARVLEKTFLQRLCSAARIVVREDDLGKWLAFGSSEGRIASPQMAESFAAGFTDLEETDNVLIGDAGAPTIKDFVHNIFHADADGLTSRLGKFLTRPMEPVGADLGEGRRRSGAVVELRALRSRLTHGEVSPKDWFSTGMEIYKRVREINRAGPTMPS